MEYPQKLDTKSNFWGALQVLSSKGGTHQIGWFFFLYFVYLDVENRHASKIKKMEFYYC